MPHVILLLGYGRKIMVDEYIDIHGTPHRQRNGRYLLIDFKPVARQTKMAHFILASTEGVVFNPNDIGMDRFGKDDIRGGPLFKLQKCTKKCYESYKQFLRTKNKTHLIVAERRFLNG